MPLGVIENRLIDGRGLKILHLKGIMRLFPPGALKTSRKRLAGCGR